MTVHARSDVASITVSAAHGGCGRVHTRPAPGGNPVPLWSLDCPQCEDFLRSDPLWASNVSEVPETPDEVTAREDFDKRGAKDKDAVLTLALARLAGISPDVLPESLTRMISGVQAHIPGKLLCPGGHANPAGQKFCGECGAGMHQTAPAAAIERPAVAPTAEAKDVGGKNGSADLSGLHVQKLKALAKRHKIDPSGTKGDVLKRLRAAGVKAAA